MERNCPVCGTTLGPQDDHCPNCGAISPSGMQGQPSGQAYPMKWFKFIIYFQLFLSAITSLISGVSCLTGANYSTTGLVTPEEVYSTFPGLRVVDLIVGVGVLVLAVLAIVVRQKLAHYRQGAPELYLTLLGADIALSVFYIVAASAVLGGPVLDASTVSELVVSAVMIGANKVYFDKRAELFVN
ncbi:MAG: zinc ribbon domain-containing protein [Candidatus Onthomonas sp.]